MAKRTTTTNLRRFGLLGDVHTEDVFLAVALEHLSQQQIDAVLCVGDIADGRGDVDRCIALLQQHQVATVRGNHDRWCVADEERDLPEATLLDPLSGHTRWYLAHLPTTIRFETVAGPLLLCHGLGTDDMAFVEEDGAELRRHVDYSGRANLRTRAQSGIEPDTRIVVGGHTHRRWAGTFGRLTFINAGTLRAGDNPCFCVADLEARLLQWYDLDDDASVRESERVALDLGAR